MTMNGFFDLSTADISAKDHLPTIDEIINATHLLGRRCPKKLRKEENRLMLTQELVEHIRPRAVAYEQQLGKGFEPYSYIDTTLITFFSLYEEAH
jgi:hypothetical protein